MHHRGQWSRLRLLSRYRPLTVSTAIGAKPDLAAGFISPAILGINQILAPFGLIPVLADRFWQTLQKFPGRCVDFRSGRSSTL
jgi:hypothetical protein